MIEQHELNAIRERCEKATPGPWWWQSDEKWFGCGTRDKVDGGVLASAEYEWEDGEVTLYIKDADAELMAHARTDIPALLAEVERLQKTPDVTTKD